MFLNNDRWYAYATVLVLVVIFSFPSRGDHKTNRVLVVSVLATISSFFASLSLIDRWRGFGHEGAAYVGVVLNLKWIPFVAVVVGISVFAILWVERVNTEWSKRFLLGLVVSSVASLTTISIFNSRIGDLILGFKNQALYSFFILFIIFVILFWRGFSQTVNVKPGVDRVTLVFVLLAVSIFAFRIDGLMTGGSWFHVGYFTGVVQTVKDGGLLLWDTPSQYGFLNILIPSLLPFGSAEKSFLYFQALMLLVVSLVVLRAIWAATRTTSWLLFAVPFIVLLNFADPALVGPQPFPSSSVIRFGPSLLLIALFSLVKIGDNGKNFIRIISFTAGVALLWSFESFFFSSMIIAGWIFGEKNPISHLRNFRSRSMAILLGTLLVSGSISVVYSLFVLRIVGGLPSWSWFYLAPSKFAEGFGSLPLDPWGAGLLIIVSIAGCVLLLSVCNAEYRQLCTASIGALLAWTTYYVGRAHSSNIIAEFPLIFVALLLPTLRVGMSFRHSQTVVRQSSDNLCSNIQAKKVLAFPITVLTIFGALIVSSTAVNPALPTTVEKFKVLPLEATFFASEGFLPDGLTELLKSAQLKKLPFAYVGNYGLLPHLPDDLAEKLDQDSTWLPVPLGLLEEPIPRNVRLRILNRRAERDPADGYLVWHKANSIPGRGEEWIKDISKTHRCVVLVENEDWQIQECKIKAK